MSTLTRLRTASQVASVLLLLVAPAFSRPNAKSPDTARAGQIMGRAVNGNQHALYSAMRKLWEDHVTWTRLFIISAAQGLPDQQATTDRLLKNQTDIGNAIKPYYGNPSGNRLTALLRDHILIAADIVMAAKKGNANAVNANKTRWFANADDIANFLSKANSRSWNAAEMRRMMREHLTLTLQEATEYLQSHYVDSVRTYDRVHGQILNMADMLSAGIVHQFPAKFR